MKDLFATLPESSRRKLRRRSQPAWTAPMLATLTDEPFTDEGWIFERKLDGVRVLVFRKGARVRLLSRSRKLMNGAWPELVLDVAKEPARDFIADGEIVAFERGRTSFARLQNRIGVLRAEDALRRRIAVRLYLFDLLHLDGHVLTALPLLDRKALLRRALTFPGRLRYTAHRRERGEALLTDACRKGWEGLIAKDASAPYVHERSRLWLKLKCVNRQELVIGGYTEGKGARAGGFGALLVGYYDDGKLRYAGKVGTGFDEATLEALGRKLAKLERRNPPFADKVPESGANFVRPVLVGEFGFTEWTGQGRLRHPRFLGLRADKPARAVRRERVEA